MRTTDSLRPSPGLRFQGAAWERLDEHHALALIGVVERAVGSVAKHASGSRAFGELGCVIVGGPSAILASVSKVETRLTVNLHYDAIVAEVGQQMNDLSAVENALVKRLSYALALETGGRQRAHPLPRESTAYHDARNR